MTTAVEPTTATATTGALTLRAAAGLSAAEVCAALDTDPVRGLAVGEVARRRERWGPNTLVTHRVRAGVVLWRQVRSPLLVLLVVTAGVSSFLGQRSDAAITGAIVAVSVGLGFVNEFRAERAAAALNDRIRHQVVAVRDGRSQVVDVAELVPGDVVDLHLGEVVPADLRLLETTGLACDESVVTGESLPVDKSAEPATASGDSYFAVVEGGKRAFYRHLPRTGAERRGGAEVRRVRRRARHFSSRHRPTAVARGGGRGPDP